MIEEFDDCEDREHKAALKNAAVKLAERMAYTAPTCPYCTPAIKGGAPGDRWHEAKGVRHWVRVAGVSPIGKPSMNIWILDAACGAIFSNLVDSGD